MAENLVTPEKSMNENDTLGQLSYKELQQLAMSVKLPANLKHSSLMALVKAHQSEDYDEVDRLVSENRQLRSRGRNSVTTSTSPVAESLTLSPPMSPECLLQMPALPLASSSPINRNHPSASKSVVVTNESLLQTKNELTEICAEIKPIPLETAIHLLCKETLRPNEECVVGGSSGTHSTDRSPDPLELESQSTYCSDSRTTSAASDIIDPVVNVKGCLDFSGKEPLGKDLTELKPVPPSELMDLSLSEPLVDPSLIMRPTFASDSLQTDTFLHPIHTLTQSLMRYPSVDEGMITSSPLVNLCVPDSKLDGHVNLSTSGNERAEYTQVRPGHTGVIPLENMNAEVASIISQHPYTQKRQSIESHYSPSKLQKISTPGNVQQCQVIVSTVPSNSSLLPVVSQAEFPKLPSSLSIAPVPATICSTAATQSSIMPAVVNTPTTSNLEGREKVELSSSNTSTLSVNTSNWSTIPSARKHIVHFSASPVTSSTTHLPARSSSYRTKSSSSGLLARPNILISEIQGKAPVPKRATHKNIGLLSKGSSNKPSTPNKKSNTVKSSHQEICYLSSDMAQVQFRSTAAKSQSSPVKKSNATNSASSSVSYARQNIRTSTQHPTTAVTTSTVSHTATRMLDQPAALPSNPNVFAASPLPTRNSLKIATPIPRPARPESFMNFHPPPNPQPILPPINHLLKDQGDYQKYGQSRQPEVCAPYPVGHGDSTGEPLPSLIQPRVDLDSHPYTLLPPSSRHTQMDFPPTQTAQSHFVGQNSAAVGQNLSHDSCLPTLRQLLEAPTYNGLPNRDSGRRNLCNPYQYESQVPNNCQFIRPQPCDPYKDMTGIGQTGNYQFPMQNFPRMPLKPPESTEKLLKTREYLADQRLGWTDLPKSLESIFNYRKDALSAVSTTNLQPAVRVPSSAIDALFVSSGIGPTQSVDYYETPICSVKSKPTRSCNTGIGSHQLNERHRSPQDFFPYLSNYPAEPHLTDLYIPSCLNAAVVTQQPCEPSWFANEPWVPVPAAAPVNQYWPQAVSHQPAMRLPQPFRAVNPRNMSNHYYSPLKSFQMPSAPAFFNQPPINNVGYQGGVSQPPPVLPEVQSYQPTELFDKVLPLQENMAQLVGQDPLAGTNQAMNQCQTQFHQDVPDFQGRGDQLSLSMIYNYLASTEHQVAANTPRPEHCDNQSQINQRPVYSRPIFPGTVVGQYQQQFGNGSASAANTTPQQSTVVASSSTSRSKYGNIPAKNVARRQEILESTTLTREAAALSVLALRRTKERQKCVNFDNGCSVILPPSQLPMHENCCEYINLKCPKETCEWNGRARKLASHVREVHRAEISSGTDSKHSLPDIQALESVCFLQEVSRKLFAICVKCHGGVLYVSIQYIASGRSERPTSASGCIEVLGHDGHPHSWRGKLLPYYQSVETLLTTTSCLEVSLSTLGAFPGSTITLHVTIRVYSGNSNAQPSH